MKKRKLIMGMAILLLTHVSYGQGLEKIQALFISKFIESVKWSKDENLQVGVYGSKLMYEEVTKILAAKNKNYSTILITSPEDAKRCQAVYLTSNQDKIFSSVLEAVRGKEILVITESESLASRGAGISLYNEGQKMKFKINPKAIEASNLKVSSALTALGIVVN